MNKLYLLLALAVALPTFATPNAHAENTPASKMCMIAETLAALDVSSKPPAMIRVPTAATDNFQLMLKNLAGNNDAFQASFPAPKNHHRMDVSVKCDEKQYKFVCYGADGADHVQCNSRNMY